MASYQHILQHTKARFESPAKVFAKLKSKVQREEICANEWTYTGKEPLRSVREKHGGVFKSPRKRSESTWLTEDFKKIQRSGSYRNEAQALTLSPISSPQKTFVYTSSDISSKRVEQVPPVTEIGYGCTPKKGAFLESTALINKQQIHTEAPQIRDSAGFRVSSRTPVKIQQVENDYESSVFEEGCAPLHKLMPPPYMVSPRRKRLKKSKWESQEFNKVSSSTREGSNESISQPQQERKTSSAFSEDNSTYMEDLDNVRGFSADISEINQFSCQPMFLTPQHSIKLKRCFVAVEKCPPMSPAKMFAYMKKMECKTEQQEAHKVNSSTRDLFDGGHLHQSRDMPPSTAHNIGEMEDISFKDVSESMVSFNLSRVASADSQSDTEPPECFQSPALSPQPVLHEDPVVLNTPRISIPKKQEAVFKRNNWPQRTKFPSESVIYLKKWFLRKNHKGLFVDGIHRDDNIPWNSNIIVDRVSNCVVKTVSGRVYILVGKMNINICSEFPKWLLKKFANGFPSDWEALYERFLSESRCRGTERCNEGRSVLAKTNPELSSIRSVKRHRQKFLKMPDACSPALLTHPKVSRSGRMLKPPLEYWKGGRVILDADMNVTIHECYDTSICIPVTTTMSTRTSQKPARVFLPCSEGRKQCESANNEEASVPLRKVKASLSRRNRSKVKPKEKPSYSPEPAVETLSSPEECSVRPTMSNRKRKVAERTSFVDTVPQKQSEPEKSSSWRSKKETHDTIRSSVRLLGKKRAVRASPESGNRISSSSQDELIGSKKTGKEEQRKSSRMVIKKLYPNMFPSDDPLMSSEEELGNRTRVTLKKHKQHRCTKSPSPTLPLPKLTEYSKKKPTAHKGNASIPADEWTDAELMKLQDAVSYYPKHMAGYWAKVARMVGTRSAEECHFQHTSRGTSQTPAKTAKKPRKEKVKAPEHPDHPIISAGVGTFKRKQQVRQFLEAMPREDVEDVFSSAYMQKKRFEVPSLCQSDQDFTLSEMEQLSPMSTGFPEVKTPQCLHISPGMMGSPNRTNNDKYVYRLQKRMKKNQFDVCKQSPSSKIFTPTVKRTMRRCDNTENDTFVVWEMLPGNDGLLSESDEEEDFYFSDNDQS
ncbi:mis18-binding protein 1 isoform X2 [Cottoperca gobio]|uniref:Mis18-binding protein 1 isoform X2 n=1 Tax=Cottoperca gobio TaxID=56716 RepID=A0A6J2S3V5_COTGO|nr:mis18-binding protein 1 isoform X2 [Cottoperca gobio]